MQIILGSLEEVNWYLGASAWLTLTYLHPISHIKSSGCLGSETHGALPSWNLQPSKEDKQPAPKHMHEYVLAD